MIGRPPRRVPADPDLAARLQQVSTERRQLDLDRYILETQRDHLIVQALEAGWTHAMLAETTGLSRARIGQIALRR